MYKTVVANPRVPIQLAAILVIAASAHAVELRVDFGVADVEEFVSATPNDVQAGFSDFSVTPTQDGVAGVLDMAFIGSDSVSRVFSGVTVTVRSDSDEVIEKTSFFDVPALTGSQPDLGEDGIYGKVTVRLAALPAGSYEMATYHLDSEVVALLLKLSFDILLDTGSGESLVASFVNAHAYDFTTAIPFTADGAQDVVMRFDGESPWINGFTLTPVPEPSSWFLLGSGVGALLSVARARSRQHR